MSDYDATARKLSEAGNDLRKAQEEIANFVPLEADRSRLATLLNNVQDYLTDVSGDLAKADEKDEATENDVRPNFTRENPAERSKTRR
jgi:hypothetical protein